MKVVVQTDSRLRPSTFLSPRCRSVAAGRVSNFGFRPSEGGIALVITLIMLSVITFMAIAFLVLSRGERTSVGTATDQSLARLAAENGLERATAEIVAPMLALGNLNSSGLLVSTNFINPNGFKPGLSNPTNVAYTYLNGTALNRPDFLQNLTNLLINPRAPVYIITNRLTGSNDFRYYLDLNRNGVFEPTGWIWVTNQGQRIISTNSPGGFLQDFVQGDPQWIGGLEFPDKTHSPDNRFLYRYAYLAIPANQTLDLNYIHNYAKVISPNMLPGAGDGFLRNQGVGTWEINLAAFLADLNTNVWAVNTAPYTYYAAPSTFTLANRGVAFDDALSLLRYRYANNLNLLPSVRASFGLQGSGAFGRDFIDGYSAGPPMLGTHWSGLTLATDGDVPRVNRSWSGSDNTNHFFTTQDLFDPTKVSQIFVNHLLAANAATNSTYNQYTFYRLLSQLGTDSAPEPAGKLNVNYDNRVQTNFLGVVSATNFFAWRPIDFFTNAASMLLTNSGYVLSLTNLQVYPTNFYTPSVHRLMQVAANIYDATTNRALVVGQTNGGFPSVFRPIFRRYTSGTNTIIAIVAYREVVNAEIADARVGPPMVDPLLPPPNNNISQIPVLGTPILPAGTAGAEKLEPMIAGIPVVVGAKKGYPNFNELSMETQVYVSRLLEFRRSPGDPNTQPIIETNQMYVVGISNLFGLEAWNSYLTSYPRNLRLITSVNMSAYVTNINNVGQVFQIYNDRVVEGRTMDIPAGTWKGWTAENNAPYSMVLPFSTTNGFRFLTNSTYVPTAPWFLPQTHIFQRASGFYVPHWLLYLNTRLQFALLDTSVVPNRVIDYVNLNNWEKPVDITYQLTLGNNAQVNPLDYRNKGNQWLTNRFGGNNINAPTYGIMNQIQVGLNGTTDWLSFSQDPYSGEDAESAVDGFRYNLLTPPGSPIYPKDAAKVFYRSNVFYAPFDPYRPIYIHTSWQANDPLVHYTIGDLVDALTFDETNRVNFTSLGIQNIGQINGRYRPWQSGTAATPDPTTDLDMSVKDPNVNRSDDWDFPTNKFPNIGWLGRVHRGTPWQTVFLKSTNYMQKYTQRVGNGPTLSMLNWMKWTGNATTIQNPALTNMFTPTLVGTNSTLVLSDALFTTPTNDWHILDLFTTAFNDNAGRGTLSVNQTNLASWSAVLSGVSVLPNAIATNANQATFILPAGVDTLPRLATIVNGINRARTNFPNHAFSRLGDVLSAPELTLASPYIVSTNRAQIINDEVVERIPQQILGLLHGGDQAPRYVIYSYGQALKPAPKSLYMGSGPYFGLCTNYQITAEVATRAVVRIDGAPTKPRAVIESFNVLPPD